MKLLVGAGKKRCVRVGPVGLNPEALCGEVPEGQPMIHRRYTRQRMPRPTEGKAEKKEAKALEVRHHHR